MSRKRRFKKILDKELYERCRAGCESGEFVYDEDIVAYLKFYEFMGDGEVKDYPKTSIG